MTTPHAHCGRCMMMQLVLQWEEAAGEHASRAKSTALAGQAARTLRHCAAQLRDAIDEVDRAHEQITIDHEDMPR